MGVLMFVFSATFAILLALIPKITRSHGLGFGQESVLDNMLVKISTSTTPPAGFTKRGYRFKARGLRHQLLYES